MEKDIPVLDLSLFRRDETGTAEVVNKFTRACEEVGFLQVVSMGIKGKRTHELGHGVPLEVIEKMTSVCETFFHSPQEKKNEVKMKFPGYPYGFSAFASESLSQSLGVDGPKDLKEAFAIGNPNIKPCSGDDSYDSGLYENLWPEHVDGFKEAFETYYSCMEKVASTIMEIAAEALQLPPSFFESKMDNQLTSLRVIYYPKLAEDHTLEGELIRAGAHSDWGSITILYVKDNVGGLEYFHRTKKEWTPVNIFSHPDGTFVINIGDLLARWTNDRWVSTLHRVVLLPELIHRDRLSIAFFNHPNADALIECIPTCVGKNCTGEQVAKYPPITSGAYLKEKFNSIQPK